ncbi:hypothetical protein BTR23_07320 [Alkalihalophilus pseudofirmus]|uniref:DUF896 domain-containing protein n=1 Tax=Alkalihalobacterium alkalinitrilicum TaxID=427920 RepID=UPI00094CFED6|nr:DUF896 domain-containing protein [Alkalihalobacterium alkalinitrilicum]OLO40291.1 hypothetical protein BTR23_07320 [Alkalihalophilus pseudofirmus]
MLSKEKIARINELAKRGKTTGLTTKEAEEQKKLRAEYVQTFRASFKQQLHSVKVVDEKGQDVTPQKLKDAKKGNGGIQH